MRVGDRIAFWFNNEVHAGNVTQIEPYGELTMVQSKTIDYDYVMVRFEDIITEEDDDEGL